MPVDPFFKTAVPLTDPNPNATGRDPFFFTGQTDPLTRGKLGTAGKTEIHDETQYDSGYIPASGDFNKFKAQQQPWYDQLANASAKTIPAIGLGIVENAGYLADLAFNWGDRKNYSNALTELAIKGREALDETLPVLQTNPNEVFDTSDPAWWINHGQGLVESIGEFLVTGAGVGGALGKGAKALQQGMRTGKLGAGLLQGGAQLATASALAEVEGAMSGARLYKEVYAAELAKTNNPELANKKASEAAAHTVKLNTLINTGLNITSVAPLFHTLGYLDDPVKKAVNRKAGESLTTYATRLDDVAKAGIPEGNFARTLAFEALQEGTEEVVNLTAEREGRIVGGLEKEKGDLFDRFIENFKTQEGILNFALGAVGGVGQTVGMNYAPLKTYEDEAGNLKRISASNLQERSQQEQLNSAIAVLKSDIDYLNTNQKALNKAVEEKDQLGIDQAKNNLFNVATLRSIRSGLSEEFANEMQSIAQIDNTELAEDGTTEAMRKGFAETPNDNEYKETATRKAADVRQLTEEYENLLATGINKGVADVIFRDRLDIYSTTNVLENLQKGISKEELSIAKLVDIELVEPLNLIAQGRAKKELITALKEELKTNPNSIVEAEVVELEKELTEIETLYKEGLAVFPENKTAILGNTALTARLKDLYKASALSKIELEIARDKYTKKLKNPKEVEKQLKKEAKAIQALVDKKQKEETSKTEAAKEAADLKKQVTEQKRKEQEKKIRKEAKVKEVPTADEKVPATAADQLKNTRKEDTYTGKTPEEVKQEKEELEEIENKFNPQDNQENGVQNKIAYRAREDDNNPTFINNSYKILHSSSFDIGTEVILKVDKDSEFFEKHKDNVDMVPIGVYHKGTLVGYLPTNRTENKTAFAIRQNVLDKGEIKTTVKDKNMGLLNKADNQFLSSEAFPVLPQFVVGINGNYHIGTNTQYKGITNKQPKTSKNGYVYAVVKTPNNKEVALPVDIKKVPKDIALSIIVALDIFVAGNAQTAEQTALAKEVFDKYNIDLNTIAGLQTYIDSFIYATRNDLNDPVRINEINDEIGKDKHYLQVTSNGIRYVKSGGAVKNKDGSLQAREVGRNSPSPEAFYNDILNHIQNMYMRVDVAKIQTNAPVKLPLFEAKEGEDPTLKEYSKESYAEYIADNTTSNVLGIPISETESTYFIQPSIYLDYSFLGKNTNKKKEVIETPKKERVILAAGGSHGLGGLGAVLPSSKIDKTEVTKTNGKERKEDC